jgi:hypothetical protein
MIPNREYSSWRYLNARPRVGNNADWTVAQDNIINQRLLVKLLKSLGCASETCSDGQECVDLFESAIRDDSSHDLRFDLVLMDVEMYVYPFLFIRHSTTEL